MNNDDQLMNALNELLQSNAEADPDRIIHIATGTATRLLEASFGAFFLAVPDKPETCLLGALSLPLSEDSNRVTRSTIALAASLTAEAIRRAGDNGTPDTRT